MTSDSPTATLRYQRALARDEIRQLTGIAQAACRELDPLEFAEINSLFEWERELNREIDAADLKMQTKRKLQ